MLTADWVSLMTQFEDNFGTGLPDAKLLSQSHFESSEEKTGRRQPQGFPRGRTETGLCAFTVGAVGLRTRPDAQSRVRRANTQVEIVLWCAQQAPRCTVNLVGLLLVFPEDRGGHFLHGQLHDGR